MALTYGGLPGILNIGQLEAAIGRPYVGYYRQIYSKAAALAESLCRNHAFADGNKRTCFALVMLFLVRSEYELQSLNGKPIARSLEDLIIDIANGQKTFEQIENWFKVRIKRKRR